METPRFQPVLVPLFFLALVGVAHRFVPSVGGVARWAGVLPLVVGLGLATWAIVHQFRRGMNPEIHKPTTALITDGPYALSRNPIYVGFVAGSVGLAWMVGWWLIVPLAPLMAWALGRYIIDVEERALGKEFGAEYEAYRRDVRRWL